MKAPLRTLLCSLPFLLTPLSAQQAAQATVQERSLLPGPGSASQPSALTTQSSELGSIEIVQEVPPPPMFTFSTTQEAFFTTNAFLTNNHEQSSVAYHGLYYGAFIPYSTLNWTPQISLEYNMFRFDRVASADFDSATLTVSSKYVFSDDRTWSWTPAIGLSRFTSPHLPGSSFYKEVTYDNQVLHEQKIQDNLYLDTAYNLTYRQTTPGIFSRLDNAVTVGLSYLITPHLIIQPFLRPASFSYLNPILGAQDRNDFNLTSGVNVTWTPIKYFSLSGDVLDTRNFSSASGQSYAATIPGLSLTGTLSF